MVIEDDRSITINVQGNKKTEYISTLRESMNNILNSYKSDKPDLHYRLILPNELKSKLSTNQIEGIGKYKKSSNLILSEKIIENHSRRNRDYYDSETGIEIPVNKTIKEYNINPSLNANINPSIKIGLINL